MSEIENSEKFEEEIFDLTSSNLKVEGGERNFENPFVSPLHRFGNSEGDNRARSSRTSPITFPPFSGLVSRRPLVSIEWRTSRPKARTMTSEMRNLARSLIMSHRFRINYDKFRWRLPVIFVSITRSLIKSDAQSAEKLGI